MVPSFEKKDFTIREGSVLDFLINNPCVKDLFSSISHTRCTLNDGNVIINNIRGVRAEDTMPIILQSLVFYPNSKLRITMY